MIIPDVNLLVYAHDVRAPHHVAARRWWESMLNSPVRVGLAWVVVLGFIRVTTHPSILKNPLRVAQASDRISGWLACANVELIEPSHDHWERLRGLLATLGTAGNLTTDAHLAALGLEHNAEVHSADLDFGRFASVQWKNPLRGAGAKNR